MAGVTPALRALGAALIVVVALVCSGCSFGGGSEESSMSQIVTAVKAADPRVTDVTVGDSVSGLSKGWEVDVVLEGAEPVTPDELSALLLAVRHAGDGDPGHVYLFATTTDGADVDLAAPADELGLSYSDISTGIAVIRDEIDSTLGAGND